MNANIRRRTRRPQSAAIFFADGWSSPAKSIAANTRRSVSRGGLQAPRAEFLMVDRVASNFIQAAEIKERSETIETSPAVKDREVNTSAKDKQTYDLPSMIKPVAMH